MAGSPSNSSPTTRRSGYSRLDGRHPLAPEGARHVGQGVLPDAVQARHPHPPERVLDDVARDFGIVLVQVGQDVDEPAVEGGLAHLGARVGVHERPGLPGVGQVLRGRAVVPGGGGRILGPGMVGTGVVRHLVLDDLDAVGVRLVHQVAQRREVAEVLVDRVEVHRAVAVIVGDGLAVVGLLLVQAVRVVVPGVEPERGDAEVAADTAAARDEAAEVAAVVVAAPCRGPAGRARRGRRSRGRRWRSGRAWRGRSTSSLEKPWKRPVAGSGASSSKGRTAAPPAVTTRSVRGPGAAVGSMPTSTNR